MATVYPETNQWLMAEDEALKKRLSNLVMPDKPGRNVPVYFRFPEAERQITFPFVTIDLIGIEPAYDLWTSEYDLTETEVEFEDVLTGQTTRRGLYEPSVNESVFNVDASLDPAMPFRRPHYLTYRLFYQITTWAKMFAHDRALTAMMFRDIFLPRPAWLEVEADHTWRRMENLGWQPADIPTQEGGTKRIFRKAFTISIQSEIPQDDLSQITQTLAVRRVAMQGFYADVTPVLYWTADESHIEPTDDGWEIFHDAGPGGPIVERLDPFVSSATGTVAT